MATIQVLTQQGLSRCSTTRVAERAGISVGSLYQYYPNRDALLAAVLEKHLVGIADAVEAACSAVHRQPVAAMAAGLVAGFLDAKLRDPAESKALYAVSAERGGPALVAEMHARMSAPIAAMLETAPDAHFEDTRMAASLALNAMVGPVRAFLDGLVAPGFETGLKVELTRLLAAYFASHGPAKAKA